MVWYTRMIKKMEDMFIRFDRIHDRDGRTDIASHDGTATLA